MLERTRKYNKFLMFGRHIGTGFKFNGLDMNPNFAKESEGAKLIK